MKKRIIKVILSIALLSLSMKGILILTKKYNEIYDQVTIITQMSQQRFEVPSTRFTPYLVDDINGIPNAVYISMVKDEEDIIYENLVWHFATGFRKFIIFDNNSNDQTSLLIRKFAKETNGLTTVFIIDDPIVAYDQSKIMTIGYRMAHELWPEVEWFFPVDADEFWIFSQDPKIALDKIPKNIDAVAAIRLRYYPSEDYATFPLEEEFWHKLHYRDSLWREFTPDRYQHFMVPKIFLRYSSDFSLATGNHFVIYKGLFSIPADQEEQTLYHNPIIDVRYDAADKYGIFMREYHMRSIEQTKKKFTNALIAASKVEKNNKTALQPGTHWTNYKHYLAATDSPDEAAKLKFESYFQSVEEGKLIDDPLPIEQAFNIYEKLRNSITNLTESK